MADADADTTVTAQGSNLDEILAEAARQLDSYYGPSRVWRLSELRAWPLAHGIGAQVPALWEAQIEATAEAVPSG